MSQCISLSFNQLIEVTHMAESLVATLCPQASPSQAPLQMGGTMTNAGQSAMNYECDFQGEGLKSGGAHIPRVASQDGSGLEWCPGEYCAMREKRE